MLSALTGDIGSMPGVEPHPEERPPRSWRSPSPASLEHALDFALAALSPTGSTGVHARLLDYYDRLGSGVGSLFAGLNPNLIHDVTPTDLLAVSLYCGPLSPLLIRRNLEPSPQRSALLRALRELPDDDLAAAGANRLLVMENLHLAARDCFRNSAEAQRMWDPATVLCARKRGDLFPNPSDPVVSVFGINPGPLAYRQTWLVYRSLLRNDDVRRQLFAISESLDHASDQSVVPDHGVLSILDATLHTFVN